MSPDPLDDLDENIPAPRRPVKRQMLLTPDELRQRVRELEQSARHWRAVAEAEQRAAARAREAVRTGFTLAAWGGLRRPHVKD